MGRSNQTPKRENVTSDEHGHLQSLSSPILCKIHDAFVFFKDAVGGRAKDKYTAFRSLAGSEGSTLHIGWDKGASHLVLVCQAIGLSGWQQVRGDQLVAPAWLANLAQDAKVEAYASKELNQFITAAHGQTSARDLRDVILNMTGHSPPRRISVVGFSAGGSVATLTATWVAVQWPTADVRCISFGAPAVGNASFVAAFRWLVSLSYRVMFRRDPVAEDSTKTSPHRLKHVHGAVYICEDHIRPGTQPKAQLSQASMRDHNADAYSHALDETCSKSMRREEAADGACRAQFDLNFLLKCPKMSKEVAAQAAAAAVAAAAATDAGSATESDTSGHGSGHASKKSSHHRHPAHPQGSRIASHRAIKRASRPARKQVSFAQNEGNSGKLNEASSDELEAAESTSSDNHLKEAYSASTAADDLTDSDGLSTSYIGSTTCGTTPSSSDPRLGEASRVTPPRADYRSSGNVASDSTHRVTDGKKMASNGEGALVASAVHALSRQMSSRGASAAPEQLTDSDCMSSEEEAQHSCVSSHQLPDQQLSGVESYRHSAISQNLADEKAPRYNFGPPAGSRDQQRLPSPFASATEPVQHPHGSAQVSQLQCRRDSLDSLATSGSQSQLRRNSADMFAQQGRQLASRPRLTRSMNIGSPCMIPKQAAQQLSQQLRMGLEAHTPVLSAQHSAPCVQTSGLSTQTSELGTQTSAHLVTKQVDSQDAVVNLDKARSIPVNWMDMASGQGHSAADGIGDAEAADVMHALHDPNMPEGSHDSLTSVVTDAPTAVRANMSKRPSIIFSMPERDSLGIEPSHLSNLQKVLVVGKISQAAVMAAAAYNDDATFKSQTGIEKSRLIRDKEHFDTKVHVGWLDDGTAVFAFRGTDNTQDGLQDVKILSRNIDYLQELYPGVKAHLGFLQQFAAVCHPDRPELNLAAVLNELSGWQTPNRVICCGHSLGGALATLGAAWAALEYPDADVRCITFGSPRVANKVFSKAFNALVGTSLRLVHGCDPVPAMPSSMLYKHVPGVIHISEKRLLLKNRPWHNVLRACVRDHSVLKYTQAIYGYMPQGMDHLPQFFEKPLIVICNPATSGQGSGQLRPSSMKSNDSSNTDVGTEDQESAEVHSKRAWPNMVKQDNSAEGIVSVMRKLALKKQAPKLQASPVVNLPLPSEYRVLS